MQVYVTHSRAWAPGLESEGDWRQWAGHASGIDSDERPATTAVPAMTRRRLTRWGRQALEVATAMPTEAQTPVIFSSRHGDTARTYKLLQDLANREPLSPNAFSLSVHNSALGIYSILADITAPTLALAGGRETLAQAWLEAQSWLATGSDQVLLVHTDEPLAEFYASDADEPELPAAIALLLSREPAPGAQAVRLEYREGPEAWLQRSLGWEFMAWWYSDRPTLQVPTGRRLWCWRRESETA